MGTSFVPTVIFLSEGNSLRELKLHFVRDINVPKFTRQLGVFSFRAFLNIGMLLTESEKAKQLRTCILDIVIATINGRAGGGTKYINWRDRDYLPTAIKSENYRKNMKKEKNLMILLFCCARNKTRTCTPCSTRT